MKYLIRLFLCPVLWFFAHSANAVLFPVEVGQRWVYSGWDSNGHTWIEEVNFTSTIVKDSVEYVVAEDGWAIHSTDTSVTGFDNIFDESTYFSFVLDSTTPTESITTSLDTFDRAFVYHTEEDEHEVWDYFVQDVGYVFVKENWYDDSGNLLLTEYAELIGVETVPEPPALFLILVGFFMLWLFRRKVGK